jgi:hypothetical protein
MGIRMLRLDAWLHVVVIVGLCLASGCARRMPPPADVRTECRSARSFVFEQVAGACAPEPDLTVAPEILERCDDATLAQVRQRLLEKGGLTDVQVERGPRRPGTSRHAIVVRYTSSEAGTCPARPSTLPLFCENCRIANTAILWMPPPCDSSVISRHVREEARIEGCGSEQLDAARERLWETGWFKQVEVACHEKKDQVAMALVQAQLQDPEELCSRFVPGFARRNRCAEVKPKPLCPDTPRCHTDANGCEVCSCASPMEKVIGELWRLPLLFK